MNFLLAITRNDVADYVSAIFVVYFILIFIRILLSWVPRMPYYPWLRATVDFIHQVVDPYLNIFRRVIPPLGAGGMGIDISPILAIIVLADRLARSRGADRRLRSRALALLVPGLAACGAVVAVDQGTKALATSLIDPGDRVEVLPFLAFENVRNKGVAFGLGGDISAALIGVTIVLLVGLLVFLAFRGGSGWLVWLPAALVLGGALGNLADRVRDGAVTDFIDLPLWPTFNLADVAITLGVLLLLLDVERSENRREKP